MKPYETIEASYTQLWLRCVTIRINRASSTSSASERNSHWGCTTQEPIVQERPRSQEFHDCTGGCGTAVSDFKVVDFFSQLQSAEIGRLLCLNEFFCVGSMGYTKFSILDRMPSDFTAWDWQSDIFLRPKESCFWRSGNFKPPCRWQSFVCSRWRRTDSFLNPRIARHSEEWGKVRLRSKIARMLHRSRSRI